MKHIQRKAFHLLGGVCLLSIAFLFQRPTALTMYVVLFFTVVLSELARLTIPSVNDGIITRFQGFIRTREAHSLTGIPFYVAGVGIAVAAFSRGEASAAVCFLAAGDVAATTIGERYGKIRIGDKSLEGSLAFVVASLCTAIVLRILGIGPVMPIAIIGAVTAMVVELLPWRINDNLTIPVLSGAVMHAVSRWLL